MSSGSDSSDSEEILLETDSSESGENSSATSSDAETTSPDSASSTIARDSEFRNKVKEQMKSKHLDLKNTTPKKESLLSPHRSKRLKKNMAPRLHVQKINGSRENLQPSTDGEDQNEKDSDGESEEILLSESDDEPQPVATKKSLGASIDNKSSKLKVTKEKQKDKEKASKPKDKDKTKKKKKKEKQPQPDADSKPSKKSKKLSKISKSKVKEKESKEPKEKESTKESTKESKEKEFKEPTKELTKDPSPNKLTPTSTRHLSSIQPSSSPKKTKKKHLSSTPLTALADSLPTPSVSFPETQPLAKSDVTSPSQSLSTDPKPSSSRHKKTKSVQLPDDQVFSKTVYQHTKRKTLPPKDFVGINTKIKDESTTLNKSGSSVSDKDGTSPRGSPEGIGGGTSNSGISGVTSSPDKKSTGSGLKIRADRGSNIKRASFSHTFNSSGDLSKIILIQSYWRMYLAKKLKKQLLKAQELVVTESNYVEVLRKIKQIFLEPAQTIRVSVQLDSSNNSLSNNWITEEECDIIFYEIQPLYNFHRDLYKKLSQRVKDWQEFDRVGVSEFFTENKPKFIQHYSGYVNNYNAALDMLSAKRRTCSRFAEFIKTCEANPECKYEDLQSLLIAPVQRVPRYGLILKELLKIETDSLNKRNRRYSASALTNSALSKVQKTSELSSTSPSLGAGSSTNNSSTIKDSGEFSTKKGKGKKNSKKEGSVNKYTSKRLKLEEAVRTIDAIVTQLNDQKRVEEFLIKTATAISKLDDPHNRLPAHFKEKPKSFIISASNKTNTKNKAHSERSGTAKTDQKGLRILPRQVIKEGRVSKQRVVALGLVKERSLILFSDYLVEVEGGEGGEEGREVKDGIELNEECRVVPYEGYFVVINANKRKLEYGVETKERNEWVEALQKQLVYLSMEKDSIKKEKEKEKKKEKEKEKEKK
eukprot:TRINITY_DN1072_c5_g1_i1.p1 TRINITY_DN1072_c5_g1~~TRINITY_DN1072_c5_g1_i1.p1  ORF type:complete len:930 (-),score=308.97 TRINITY_DN1072_c5_g1_i1:444-3233(-)